MVWLWWGPQALAGAWVLESASPRRLARAARIVERAADTQATAIGPQQLCAALDAPDERLRRRVARQLEHPPEERLDCDVAQFPLGRGWVAVVVESPAKGLAAALEAADLAYVDVRWPIQEIALAPVRVCVAKAALVEPMALAHHIEAHGDVVRAVYEVGGCVR